MLAVCLMSRYVDLVEAERDTSSNLRADAARLREIATGLERRAANLERRAASLTDFSVPQVLSLAAAAEFAHVGTRRVQRWCQEGLAHRRNGARYEISRSVLIAWLEDTSTGVPGAA